MEKRNKYGFFIVMLFCACTGALSPDKYMAWIEDENNACVQKKSISGIHYIAMYRPADYMTLKEMQGEPGAASFNELKKEFGGMEYYTLRMGAASGGKDVLLHHIASEQDYYERVNYYTANAQADIYLVQGRDTFPCELYHYERAYGVSPYNNMLLGFATPAGNTEPAKLHFNDRVFNAGLLIFSFNKTAIPQLKNN